MKPTMSLKPFMWRVPPLLGVLVSTGSLPHSRPGGGRSSWLVDVPATQQLVAHGVESRYDAPAEVFPPGGPIISEAGQPKCLPRRLVLRTRTAVLEVVADVLGLLK